MYTRKKSKTVLGDTIAQMRETLHLFGSDLTIYIQRKLSYAGGAFEGYKSIFVGLLMAKRGRYQGPFLNLSVFILAGAGIIAAPHISAYYPTLPQGEILSSVAPAADSMTDLNLEEMAMVTQISDKPRDQVIDYTVRSGDTLSTIATTFDVSEDTIKWANNLEGANPLLKPDQVLKIPPVTGVVHKVSRGDTVYTIAKKYQTEPQNIVNYPFNDFVDLDNFTLAVGQILIVPDGARPEEKKVPATRPAAPEYLAKQSSGQYLFPTTGGITQNPVWYHMAIDIANSSAPDVYAAESGTASLVTCLTWGYGCHIMIDHPDGNQTLYGHLQAFYISPGQSVSRGQAIGRMGSTGRSTGTHLHFEVRVGGTLVNPWNFVK